MALLDLDGTEQPMDPMLAMAIEAAFRKVSLTQVTFVPAPRAFRKSNPKGSASGPKPARKAQIKLDLAERDGFRCAYCTREFIDLDDATLDHVIPNSVVGHWETWNLVLACEPCNNLKADNLPLVLMPLLCSLLNSLTGRTMRQLYRFMESKRKAEVAARWRVIKFQKRKRKALERRLAIVKHLESLTGAPVRLAIEAAPVRAALPAGGQA